MNEFTETKKPWWQSKTILGGAVVLILTLAEAFGVVDNVTPEDKEQATKYIVSIGTAIGGLLAVYGRVKADKAIEKPSDRK